MAVLTASRWAPLLLLAAGCQVERAATVFAEQERPDTERDASILADGGIAAGGLAAGGTWALFLEDADCLEAMGQSVAQHVWTAWRVEMEPLGPGGVPGSLYLRLRLRMCRQEVSPAVAGLVTVVPRKVAEALPEREIDAMVLADGETLAAEELYETWGTTAARDEPLPVEGDDPAVTDDDGDGHPGVTLVLGTGFCDLYVVRRARYRLAGTVTSPGRVDGTFWSRVEKNVLASTSPLCTSPSAITDAPYPSRFALARADGVTGTLDLDLDDDGEVGCDELVEAEPLLREAGAVPYSAPDHEACE